MPAVVQSTRPCTSLEIARKILPRTFRTSSKNLDRRNNLEDTFLPEFYLDYGDTKALRHMPLIFFIPSNVTTMVLIHKNDKLYYDSLEVLGLYKKKLDRLVLMNKENTELHRSFPKGFLLKFRYRSKI